MDPGATESEPAQDTNAPLNPVEAPVPSSSNPATPTSPTWPALTAGFVFVAGALHLLLVESHMGHALGAGLFFLGIGITQILWAFVFLRNPTRRLEHAGLAILVVAPTVLYVLTRIMRAPWSDAPEPVDLLGIVTVLAQLGAAATMLAHKMPTFTGQQVRAMAGAGILLATAGYGGAIAAEGVDWLSAASVGHGDDHGGSHGASGGDGHGGHGTLELLGTRGVSVVGTTTYFGPTTGHALETQCRDAGYPSQDCWLHHIEDLLEASGSIAAFDLLVSLTKVNSEAYAQSHVLAHELGHHAYLAYGLDISLTLGECSYEVFQGCIHGALQAYFDDLSRQGATISDSALNSLCSAAKSRFETYTCYHGVGHGITMYTNYDVPGSLDTCAKLTGWFEEASCVGGVFMENVVAYHDSLAPDYVPHAHGDGTIPSFWIKPEDPAFPCNVVKSKFASACWRMQTSVILRANGGDFEAASRICDEQGNYAIDCYSSLGRDAAPYGNREASKMSKLCSYASTDAFHQQCVSSFTAGVILQENSPQAGMDLCPQLAAEFQKSCYHETGKQSRFMLSKAEVAELCKGAPEQYESICRDG